MRKHRRGAPGWFDNISDTSGKAAGGPSEVRNSFFSGGVGRGGSVSGEVQAVQAGDGAGFDGKTMKDS